MVINFSKAAIGAFFRVTHKETGKMYVGQLKPLNHELSNYISINNVIDGPNLIHLHEAIADKGLVVLIVEADRSLFDSPMTEQSRDNDRIQDAENEAKVFAKQLLTALQYMHHRNIAHLDLRPEAVLLQDDHLRLADFGQSRHLIRGKVTGNIKATPEFVSPEIAQGQTVTLAADMWSAGSLIYVLLTGVSPFLGNDDRETLTNIVNGNYSLDSKNISNPAKDFIRRLLLVDPGKRMSVDQALSHEWLSGPALADAELRIGSFQELKYRHKWLERRVFVQQSPSDKLSKLLESPRRALQRLKKVNAADNSRRQMRPPLYDVRKMPPSGQVPRQFLQSRPGIKPKLPPPEILAKLGIDPRKQGQFQVIPLPKTSRKPKL
uniref:Protein kinase domain-containing protein n=1 Tax=Bursaphelenchus xylophilus TaxID=6326 RepID=A0A1I7S952_BURXY